MLARWLFVRRHLGMRLREWVRWAFEHPHQAAFLLDSIAALMRHRADQRRRQKGWLAQWGRAIALALEEQARELLRAAELGEPTRSRCLAEVCEVPPGTWAA